jgi:epoxyqueuosine reductase QueG
MITREDLQRFVSLHLSGAEENVITGETAAAAGDIGSAVYDEPLICIASADDPLWEEFKRPEAGLPLFRAPKEWLPEAKSVISVFGPFSDHVLQSNSADPVYTGSAWLSAYNTGGALIKKMSGQLAEWLSENGWLSVAPVVSGRFYRVMGAGADPSAPQGISYTSNWSERHAAFAAGHGTFGLSRGLITKRGVAGRFASVVTALPLDPAPREYTGLYEYCTMCGRCADNCPAGAISREDGKKHAPCNAWLDKMGEWSRFADACGKCQVNVPCMKGIPGRA